MLAEGADKVAQVVEADRETGFGDGSTIVQSLARGLQTPTEQIGVGRNSHEFAEYVGKVQPAHASGPCERTEGVWLREIRFHQLADDINPVGIPMQLGCFV